MIPYIEMIIVIVLLSLDLRISQVRLVHCTESVSYYLFQFMYKFIQKSKLI